MNILTECETVSGVGFNKKNVEKRVKMLTIVYRLLLLLMNTQFLHILMSTVREKKNYRKRNLREFKQNTSDAHRKKTQIQLLSILVGCYFFLLNLNDGRHMFIRKNRHPLKD